MKTECRRTLFSSVLAILAISCQLHAVQLGTDSSGYPQRIISLAPGITEILFALGLGDRVIGVSRYCDYPPAVSTIARVGGYFDPSFEQIVSLEPDLTVLLTSHQSTRSELEKLGLRILTTPHETIADVHESIGLIGEATGVEGAADSLSRSLRIRSDAVRRAVEGKERPRVLICIGRDTESDQLSGMYMAGRSGIYDEIIDLAGGVNAYEDATVAYPQMSAEGVLQLNPDVIVDLVGDMMSGTKDPDQIMRQWQQLPGLNAVRSGKVHVIVGNRALRPGPRYVEFLEQMAKLLHPEVFHKSMQRE